jgi:hypothetical protein
LALDGGDWSASCPGHLTLVYPDINLLSSNINTIKEETETILGASRDVGLEINAREDKVYDHVLSPELRTELEYKDN